MPSLPPQPPDGERRAERPAGSARTKRRDTAALPPFSRVVDQHGPAVLRFCLARAGPQRAEDCFQDTLLAALRSYEQVRDPQGIGAWLFSIAARKTIDAHRASLRAPEPTDQIDERAVAAPALAVDEALWERVRALPPKQHQAVTLRYRADLTHAEIARVMDTNEAAARRNVFEGLERLRRDT